MNHLKRVAYRSADIFNKTALGVCVLTSFYLLYTGYYLRGAAILIIGLPTYFWLYDRFGGMPEEVDDAQ